MVADRTPSEHFHCGIPTAEIIAPRTYAAPAAGAGLLFGHWSHVRWLVLVAVTFAGCATSQGPRILESPLSCDEQQREILAMIPIGTPRAAAEEKLKDANIEYSMGKGNSICYCDVWNRTDGSRWHLNVALLFDKEGKLYETRKAAADITPDYNSPFVTPAKSASDQNKVNEPFRGSTPALNAAGRD